MHSLECCYFDLYIWTILVNITKINSSWIKLKDSLQDLIVTTFTSATTKPNKYLSRQTEEDVRSDRKLSVSHGLPCQFVGQPGIMGLDQGLTNQILDMGRNEFPIGCLEHQCSQVHTRLESLRIERKSIKLFSDQHWKLFLKNTYVCETLCSWQQQNQKKINFSIEV